MLKMEKSSTSWIMCEACKGRGKKSRRLRKKVRLQYQRELEAFEKSNDKSIIPIRPKGHLYTCVACSGSGLIVSDQAPLPDKENYPHVAIIGGGIGGVALAVACLHRRIPFTLYERDERFDARSQGYGLTLQQASKAIEGLGILSLDEGIVSTRHLVHTTDGQVVGEWGMRKWTQASDSKTPKRTNIHIARQSLRLELIKQLGGPASIQWGHQLVAITTENNKSANLCFQVNGEKKSAKADLVVGADGIRSTVRDLIIGEEETPLQYLDCMVILGICPLNKLKTIKSTLLDSATVFQTANGRERMYMMPYSAESIMWQLSFPVSENEAKKLNAQGAKALKKEALKKASWHDPIPQILEATEEAQISGYPVYDRELLDLELLEKENYITLIGDAAHPMSPFKGQGANQALLDALSLARKISVGCGPLSKWKEEGMKKNVLSHFELEMITRSASKVKDSAAAATFLHSEVALHKSNAPRGRYLKEKNNGKTAQP